MDQISLVFAQPGEFFSIKTAEDDCADKAVSIRQPVVLLFLFEFAIFVNDGEDAASKLDNFDVPADDVLQGLQLVLDVELTRTLARIFDKNSHSAHFSTSIWRYSFS